MEVTGIRFVSFKDKKDPSKTVSGVTLFASYPITKNGEGYGCERLFLSDWFVEHRLGGEVPKMGDQVEPSYTRNGKLSELRILAPEK